VGTPSLAGRVHQWATRETRRATRNPFPAGAPRVLVVHCAHHKAGSVWFRKVVMAVVAHYGLRKEEGKRRPLDPEADVAFYNDAGTFDPEQIGARPFRGTHLVRDPRDMVVSGYEYHLTTTEPWALRPDPRFGGLSYQEHLRSLDPHAGLRAEIAWQASGTAAAMARWDYGRPEFLELHYEDAVDDERATFERLFRWYGFDDAAVAVGLDAVDRFTLKQGGALSGHVRSGIPGEWRTRFDPDHRAYFQELTGDLLVRLGYEASPDW
jgi:hypothetical protein